MSLLMEALRKAEEAKRIAAQKTKEGETAESSTALATPSATQKLSDSENTLEQNFSQAPETAAKEEPEDPSLVEFSFASDEIDTSADFSETQEANLDIPFDFQIDESFGIDSEKNEPEAPEESLLPLPAVQESDPEIHLDPDPAIEQESNTIEFDLAKAPEPEPEIAPPPTSLDESENTVEVPATNEEDVPVKASEPISASREETEGLEAPARDASTTRIVEKVGRSAAADESRRRESARAVFNAKSPLAADANKRKLLIAASLLAFFPLAGGAYLLLSELGILGGGNQYNIPASYTPVEPTFNDPIELADTISEQQALPDVSAPAAIVLIDDQAIDEALATVVTSLSPAIAPANEIANTTVVAPDIETPTPVVEELFEPGTEEEQALPLATQELVSQESVAAPVLAEAEQAEANPISIVRSDNTPRVHPQLVQAYDAYKANDYITARAHYQQVLRETPNSRDAMLGIAAVSLKVGDAVNARETYLRLLQLDPRDVLARVGLLETMPASDPVALETELKSLFEEHPDVAHLAFSLGNLYASQRRWNEAQQSYYDALLAAKSGVGPVSPDYAFNLAVSLERLNQVRPAYSFYREALEQSREVNPTFDPRILRERLDALERMLP